MIKNLIKNGRQKKAPDDSGKFQKAQVSFLGQIKNARQITPYGLYSSSVVNSNWILFSSRGNVDDIQGIANDYENRPKNLKEGEVVLQNLKTGAFIKLDSDGNINATTSGNIVATATNAAITATNDIVLNAANNITMTANTITINGINFGTHVHKENDVPNDTDGPKNP